VLLLLATAHDVRNADVIAFFRACVISGPDGSWANQSRIFPLTIRSRPKTSPGPCSTWPC